MHRRARRSLLALCVALSCLGATAPSAFALLSLDGVLAQNIDSIDDLDTSTRCNADGSGTIEFTVTANTTSPYVGWLTETGTVSLSPTPWEGSSTDRMATSLQSQFTITTTDGKVITGTRTLVPTSNSRGACRDPFDPLASYAAISVQASYQAEIRDAASGRLLRTDDGMTRGDNFQSFFLHDRPTVHKFAGNFDSARDDDVILEPDPEEVADADGDGVHDPVDNCVSAPNTDQLDSDGDLMGDVCDEDDDNDFVDDGQDNCRVIPNATQRDSDGDGTGDACDGAFDSTDGKATGGGFLATNAGKVHLSFTARSAKGKLDGTGRVQDGGRQVRLADVTGLYRDGGRAVVVGNATVDGAVTSYRLEVVDGGEPSADTFDLEAGAYHLAGSLAGGNLQVR